MSSQTPTELKNRIALIRNSYNIKKNGFAKKLGISSSYVTDLESGKRDKISAILSKLIYYEFNINEKWLLNGEGEMFSDAISISNLDKTTSEILGFLKDMNEKNKNNVLDFIKEKQLLTEMANFIKEYRKFD